jgi:hypothetical protein
MKKYCVLAGTMCVTLALLLQGCSDIQSSSTGTVSENTVSVRLEDMFSDRDMEVGYDENEAALITLSGDTAECTSDAVRIDENVITITDEGTYILSGTLDDGMVVIDAEDKKPHLILDNVTIQNSDSAAIYIKKADKVFMTLASDTENYLSNGGNYEAIDDNNIDSVIFSKSDLTLNGTGKLTIDAQAGHGIVSKDDLVITGGQYDISCEGHGLSGKDSIRIAAGIFQMAAGNNAVDAENEDDTDKGFIYIENGTFDIIAEGDGAKGIKASGDLLLYGGSYIINSSDDALHSNSDVTICGGSYQIETGDDGIHADAALNISNGEILITQSYEGIEGMTVDISGGNITLTASDDGINAAGGNDQSGFGGGMGDQFAAQTGVYIQISGGKIYVNASGDGVDSNGDLTVSGGEIYISGPTNGGNGALDYNGDAVISGGICIAAGASGMEQNFGNESTQCSMMVDMGLQEAGTAIELTDSTGKVLLSWQPEKSYQSVVLSCPEMTQGNEYTVTAGEKTAAVTMSDIIYGTGNGMGEPGGMQKQGGKMEKPDGMEEPDGTMEKPDGTMERPEGMEKPDGTMEKPDGMEEPDGAMEKPDGMEEPDGTMERPDGNMKMSEN